MVLMQWLVVDPKQVFVLGGLLLINSPAVYTSTFKDFVQYLAFSHHQKVICGE
jgi:hypothetical protein